MAKQQKQATEEYKTPILSGIYKVFGFLCMAAGLVMSLVGEIGLGLISVFVGISLFGAAHIFAFIYEIVVNTRKTALNSAILAANASGQVECEKENDEIDLR